MPVKKTPAITSLRPARKVAAKKVAAKKAPLKNPVVAKPVATKPARGKRRPVGIDAVRDIFTRFQAANPEPKGELDYVNPFTLLVAVVLSALFMLLAWPVGARMKVEGDKMLPEKRLFKYSIVYLFVLFAALVADRVAAYQGWMA
jgi:hypothetical protein